MEPREEDLVAQPEEEEAPQAEKTGDKAEATDDKDLEQLKQKLAALEETLKDGDSATSGTPANPGAEKDEDKRSIFVGNVHFRTKPEELQEHFKDAGTINRVTILVDKFTGQPKGFAYVEFESEACVAKALALEGSMLHQRPLKVVPKRTNVPRFQLPGRRPSPRSRYPMYRPRRRPHYNPYGYQ